MGWAVVEVQEPLFLYLSGYLESQKHEEEKHFDYLDRMLIYTYDWWKAFFTFIHIDVIYCERLPVVLKSIQASSARIAITACRLAAHHADIPWIEIGASTVKKDLTGDGKASKVTVRNAVLREFPELTPRKKELTTYADESDAIGVAIIGAKRASQAAQIN